MNVSIEILEFPLCIKNKILRIKNITKLNIEFDKKNVSIKIININKKEINNIGYLFRENCFDLVVNSNDKSLILSSYNSKEDIDSYVKSLSEFYKTKKIIKILILLI